jgi:hypothetical protein
MDKRLKPVPGEKPFHVRKTVRGSTPNRNGGFFGIFDRARSEMESGEGLISRKTMKKRSLLEGMIPAAVEAMSDGEEDGGYGGGDGDPLDGFFDNLMVTEENETVLDLFKEFGL